MLSRATSDIWTAVVNLHPGGAGFGVYLGVSQNQGYLIRDLGDPKGTIIFPKGPRTQMIGF